MFAKVETFNLAVWRYSNLSADHFLPSLSDYEKWRNWVLEILQKPYFVDRLADLYGENGRFFVDSSRRIIERAILPLSKSVEKRMDYLTQLFISLTYRNDTGKKGSVSLVSLTDQINYCNERVEVIYPEGVNTDRSLKILAEQHNSEINLVKRKNMRKEILSQNHDYFRFFVDLSQRLEPKKITMSPIIELHEKIGRLLSDLVSEDQNMKAIQVIPFCVDYLLSEKGPLVLEIHCPPRTIEVMFYGFRPFFRRIEYPVDILMQRLAEVFRHRMGYLPDSIAFFCPVPGTAFFQIEAHQFLKNAKTMGLTNIFLNNELSDVFVKVSESGFKKINSYIDIKYFLDKIEKKSIISEARMIAPPQSVIENVEDLNMMMSKMDKNNIPHPKSLYYKRYAEVNFEFLRKELGDWIVLKSRKNEPWWSTTKIKTQFLCLTNNLHQKKLVQILVKSDIILEQFITDSLDKYGHFGELRLYGFVECV